MEVKQPATTTWMPGTGLAAAATALAAKADMAVEAMRDLVRAMKSPLKPTLRLSRSTTGKHRRWRQSRTVEALHRDIRRQAAYLALRNRWGRKTTSVFKHPVKFAPNAKLS